MYLNPIICRQHFLITLALITNSECMLSAFTRKGSRLYDAFTASFFFRSFSQHKSTSQDREKTRNASSCMHGAPISKTLLIYVRKFICECTLRVMLCSQIRCIVCVSNFTFLHLFSLQKTKNVSQAPFKCN